MKKALLSAAFLFISLAIFAQAKDSTDAWHYKTDNYDCAIFPMAYVDYLHTGKTFTPGFGDIDKAEHAMLEQLLLQRDTTKRLPDIYRHLKKYKRQYFGFTNKDGHKILLINLFWDDKSYNTKWLSQMVVVDGGGSSYWKIEYDLTDNKLSGLQINADE